VPSADYTQLQEGLSMKQFFAVVALSAFLVVGLSAAESAYYSKTVPVAKIVSHELGYKVTYLTNKFEPRTIYLPMEWLYQTGSYRTEDGFVRAEVVRGFGEQYPYMQLFWKDGKFHHLRLFVVDNYSDRSWGTVGDPVSLAAQFDPKKELDLKF
jgi:hypothetical protein